MRKSIFILLALTSCMSTEVIGIVPETKVDTTVAKKPHKPLPPTPPTPPADTGRVAIGFNPTVEDWEQADTTDIEI
jgi:hypothetical protein